MAAGRQVDDTLCDHLCQCQFIEGGLSIHCVRKSFRSVPGNIPVNVTLLDLSMNNISSLGNASFPFTLLALRRLDLRMNGLTDIQLGSLSNLASLEELGLDHNTLTQLRPGVLSHMSSLSVLSLNNNNITLLPNETFTGLSLKHLNLHDNGRLRHLAVGAFDGAKVESLALDRCDLSIIPDLLFAPLGASLKNVFWSHNLRPLRLPVHLFRGLDLSTLWLSDNRLNDLSFLAYTQAVHLDLSINPIGRIDFGAYMAMEHVEFLNLSQTQLRKVVLKGGTIMFNLQELDLSVNYLTSIDFEVFQRMPSLQRLDVSNNLLHTIADSFHMVVFQLEFWDLTDNPLLCDCRLEWFRKWSKSHNKTHLLGAVCAVPKRTPVISSPEFTCKEPTITRISSDMVENTWTLQCDAEGWPSPRITWHYNISTAQASTVHINTRWIAYHGHPYRNSSILIINNVLELPRDYCFHFLCIGKNFKAEDRTEYVHCNSASSEQGESVSTPRIDKDTGVSESKHDRTGIYQHQQEPQTDTGYPLIVGLSTAAAIVCVTLLLGAVFVARRRLERLMPRGRWDPPEGAAGEGLTDSTKCLVEHPDSNDKCTFSIDTV